LSVEKAFCHSFLSDNLILFANKYLPIYHPLHHFGLYSRTPTLTFRSPQSLVTALLFALLNRYYASSEPGQTLFMHIYYFQTPLWSLIGQHNQPITLFITLTLTFATLSVRK